MNETAEYRRGYEKGAFDTGLDAYQAREREAAARREAQGDIEARRPDAVREACTFADVQAGDFITNESGPEARWVELLTVLDEPDGETLVITFRVPQPIGVGYHERWVITRPKGAAATRDASVVIDR